MKYLILMAILAGFAGCKDCQRNNTLYQDSYYKCMGTNDTYVITTAWNRKHDACMDFAEDLSRICKD